MREGAVVPLIVGIPMKNEWFVISGQANILSVDFDILQGPRISNDKFIDVFGFELGSPVYSPP